MNAKKGFRRAALVLGIVVGICAALVPLSAIYSARDFVQGHEHQLEYFKEGARSGQYSDADVVEQEQRLKEARGNPWAGLSLMQTVAVCVLTGVAAFCAVLLVHRVIEWVALGFFCDDR